MFPCYRPTKRARFTDSANDQQSRLTWIIKVKRTKASGWKITISLACFCDRTVGNSQQKTLLWNRKIIVTVKINDKVLVLLSFSEPENPQVLLLKSVWRFIQKSIISRKGLVPSNNCSNYKDSKRLKQHPLSYPFIQAHGPELHMYHVYYYGNKANLIRAKPTNNQTAPSDKICLATSWICWAAAPANPAFLDYGICSFTAWWHLEMCSRLLHAGLCTSTLWDRLPFPFLDWPKSRTPTPQLGGSRLGHYQFVLCRHWKTRCDKSCFPTFCSTHKQIYLKDS